MPPKPRDQWKPNDQLRAARERVYGRKSRTPFARAIKRRCEVRFGGHCGVDHRRVRRWEDGESVPDLCHQEVLCYLFEVPWEERDQLGLPVPTKKPDLGLSSEGADRLAHANGQCPVCGGQIGATGATSSGGSRQEGMTAERREFLRLVKVFACIPVPLDALERFAASLQRPGPVDEALVQDVERIRTAVEVAYNTTAPRRLLVPARLLVERTTRLLEGSMLSTERERLMRCASGGALHIGWLRINLDQRAEARASFLLAQELAGETPDAVMQAKALGSLSRVHSTIDRGGDGAKALQFAGQANALLPGHAPADVCSWLACREAIEHAASDQVAEYGRLTQRAEEAMSQAQSELGMAGSWEQASLSAHKGACLWLLNQPAAAEQVLLEGLKHSSLSRPRARMARYLAQVYTAQNDAEAACGMGVLALKFIRDVGSVIGLQGLIAARSDFPDDWAGLSYVQEFDEQLRATARSLRLGGGRLSASVGGC